MSSTRYQSEDAPLRQERFASSQEFERGLIASMVARRCSVLDAPADRELIWYLHFMSHREGRLKAIVADLLTKHRDRLGTAVMRRIGKRAGNYSADQVREVRNSLPREFHNEFLLKGECWDFLRNRVDDPRISRAYEDMFNGERERAVAEADKLPTQYAVADFEKLCRAVAADGIKNGYALKIPGLEDHLRRLCLDPGLELATAAPWYFAELVPTLRDYMQAWIAERKAGAVVTSLGQKVCDVLDYTAHSKSMTLVEGIARIGKSFYAREIWCEQHPGQVRFVEVPTGNDETNFFRTLARGLGVGNFTQSKAGEIKERVESVLLTGDLVLVLDEAQRLLPQMNLRYGYPKRIEWLLSMVNAGVPVCLIAALPNPVNGVPPPTFVERLVMATKHTGWNEAQFIGRLKHYEQLPNELTLDDLMAVAAVALPEADKSDRRALAAYARLSASYLAAIEKVTSRASYIASKAGRATATQEDIKAAMAEVVPSDSKLALALNAATKTRGRGGRNRAAESPAAPATSQALPPRREVAPPEIDRNRITGGALELVEKE